MWSFLAHSSVLSTIQLTVDPSQQGYPAVNIIANPTEHLLARFPYFPLHSKCSHCLFIESRIKARKDHCDHLTSNQELFPFFDLIHLPTLDVDAEHSLQKPVYFSTIIQSSGLVRVTWFLVQLSLWQFWKDCSPPLSPVLSSFLEHYFSSVSEVPMWPLSCLRDVEILVPELKINQVHWHLCILCRLTPENTWNTGILSFSDSFVLSLFLSFLDVVFPNRTM